MLLSIDFDGVLHACELQAAVPEIDAATPAQLRAAGLFEHAALLAELLEPHPEARLIVHSAWRMTSSLERLRSVLGPLAPRLVGVTSAALDRELSILAWLRQHGLDERAVVVLDDEPELFKRLVPRLVTCDQSLGLAAPAARSRLRELLMHKI